MQHNLDLVLNESDARFIASRRATAAAPIVGVDTQTDPPTDLESLVGSLLMMTISMTTTDTCPRTMHGDADSSHHHHTGACARPHATHSRRGDAT